MNPVRKASQRDDRYRMEHGQQPMLRILLPGVDGQGRGVSAGAVPAVQEEWGNGDPPPLMLWGEEE